MDPIATFQGLSTGINFRDLVDQIIQAESSPITLLQGRVTELDRKTTAWGDVETRVQTIFDRSEDLADGLLFNTFKTALSGVTAGASAPFTVSASTSAQPSSFTTKVLQLATREKVGSDVFSKRTTALGFSGELLVGGKAVTISATDSLDEVAASFNQANTGTTPSGVTASIVSAAGGGYRLVLTAAATGKAGIDLADGSGGALASLGFLDTTTSLKHATSDGAKSDTYLASSTAVATLLGLSTPPASGSVTIGGFGVTIDLANDSLDDIALAINTAATGAGSSVTAQVVTETDSGGTVRYRLDVDGTTSFTDSGAILQTLGVVKAGRGAVAQAVTGAALTDGDAVTAATGSTLLTNLWAGGADASVLAGDTLTLQGTRGDGSTFTKTFTVAGGDTYQDLVDSLNSAVDGFKVGSRTATASIAANGSLVVTDDTGGDSRLALTVIANNEGGGTLDLGDFSTTATGRAREITAGLDAQLEVDGVFFSRASNTVSDVVDGVTLNLNTASADTVTVDVTRDVDAIVTGVTDFIKSFNALSEFVTSQFNGAGADEGELRRPLSGDSTVRQIRTQFREALETAISSSATSLTRLSEMGITLNRQGTYDIDAEKLRAKIEADATSVQRYFAVYGAGSTSTLEYVSAGDEADSGAYAVNVTQAATQAATTGVGFAGTYVDDATADTLTVTDAATGSTYQVSLTNGMTMTQIVDALNTELADAKARSLAAANALFSDAVGTAATDTTTLGSLYDSGGTSLGVANGDVITISGTLDDATSFFREWTLTDVSTQTLGDLRSEISAALGTDVVLSYQSGVLTATAIAEGRRSYTLAVTSDNAGGGTFNLGGISVTEAGRGAASITASDSGGQLKLLHSDYGSGPGFDVAFTAGGTDGTASLGVAAGSYRGLDVQGTIGGQAATGSGQLLTAATGTAAEGLLIRYEGTTTGAVGTMTFSRGIASLTEILADTYLGTDDTAIQGIVDRIDTQKKGMNDRIDALEDRLARRAEQLIKRFTALEEAMAMLQSQQAWLQAQLGSLTTSGS